MADIPLQVISDNSSSERRITPTWTIAQLKGKLEPITGIPPWSQVLFLKTSPSSPDQIAVTAPDEESTTLAAFPLAPYAELLVSNPTKGCPIILPPSIRRQPIASHQKDRVNSASPGTQTQRVDSKTFYLERHERDKPFQRGRW
ncbi:Cell polarity protein-like protein [Zalerion maritima]|uniref:Cell polarity protein-like protein n=1 Tax=Zalerion maritima TaxID=339359 RepID=A0AAD5RX93_9PEZI|nr:Cell polarity protein-like protein [Zalerion maritima]